MESNQINPNHYKASGMETWEMMLKIWGTEAFIKHCEMCAFKYRMRAGLKQGASVETDLAKANWYEAKAKMLKGGTEPREPYTNPHNVVEDELVNINGVNFYDPKGVTIHGDTIKWDDKEPITISTNQFKGAKELIPVDSLVEVPIHLSRDGGITHYRTVDTTLRAYCKIERIDQSKIKRIFLEMEK